MPHGTVNDPHVFVAIDPAGTVTIVAHRSEMGTGVAHQPADGVADEMEADWSRVRSSRRRATSRDTATRTPTARAACAISSSPCGSAVPRCGRCWSSRGGHAVGRAGRPRCDASNHEVVHRPRAGKLGYGELAEAAMDAAGAAGRPAQAQGRGRLPLHRQGRRPDRRPARHHHRQGGLRHGHPDAGHEVRRGGAPPVVGGKVKSFDAAEAMKVPGVEKVVEIQGTPPPAKFAPLGGVAVVAQQHLGRDQGPRRAEDRLGRRPERQLQLDGLPRADGGDRRASRARSCATRATRKRRWPGRPRWSRPSTTCRTWRTRRWSRRRPRRASPTASARSGRRVQSPYGAREDWPSALGMPIENVTVHVTLLGGGFGRKSKCDFVHGGGAALEGDGRQPVKVHWTREDDIQHGFYHTVSVEHIEAGARRRGQGRRRGGTAAWRRRSSRPSCRTPKHERRSSSGMGLVDMPFDIPNLRCENGEADGAYAHRLVPLGLEHPARLRRAVVRGRAGRMRPGEDPKDYPARADRPGAHDRSAPRGAGATTGTTAIPTRRYPIDTGRLRQRRRDWRPSRPAGAASCPRGMGSASRRTAAS